MITLCDVNTSDYGPEPVWYLPAAHHVQLISAIRPAPVWYLPGRHHAQLLSVTRPASVPRSSCMHCGRSQKQYRTQTRDSRSLASWHPEWSDFVWPPGRACTARWPLNLRSDGVGRWATRMPTGAAPRARFKSAQTPLRRALQRFSAEQADSEAHSAIRASRGPGSPKRQVERRDRRLCHTADLLASEPPATRTQESQTYRTR